jgi:hypothetical protein
VELVVLHFSVSSVLGDPLYLGDPFVSVLKLFLTLR